MTNSFINEALANRQKLRENEKRCLEALRTIEIAGGTRLDLDKPIQNVGFSVVQTHSRVIALVERLGWLEQLNEGQIMLVPRSWLDGIAQDTGRVADKLEAIRSEIEKAQSTGGFTAIDDTGFILTRVDNSNPLNVTQFTQELSSLIDAAFERLYRLTGALKDDTSKDFGSAIFRLSEILNEITQINTTAENLGKQINITQKKAETASNKAADDGARVDQIRIESEAILGGVKASNDQITNAQTKANDDTKKLLATIETINSKAATLNGQIDAFQPKLADFESKIAQRNNEFSEGTTSLKALTDQLATSEAEANRIIGEAKVALGWGTVQSLTARFSTSADELTKPVKDATFWVNASLILFGLWVVSVLVAPGYFDPSLRMLSVPEHADGWITLLYILSNLGIRLAIIAPAFLFYLFANQRYTTLSNLREQYIFKKTIASAIPGFKEQAADSKADQNVKAMTLAAFERLLVNPKDKDVAVQEEYVPTGWLSKKLIAIVKAAVEQSKKD